MFSSIYSKANFDRLKKEIDRAKDGGIGFDFVATDSVYKMIDSLEKIKKIKRGGDIISFNKLMELNRYLSKCGFSGVIISGRSNRVLGFIIRRLIKSDIKKNLK